jgi:hypothetical protein
MPPNWLGEADKPGITAWWLDLNAEYRHFCGWHANHALGTISQETTCAADPLSSRK